MNDKTELADENDIYVRSRNHVDRTGVKDVLSFDERSVVAVTSGGNLALEGEDLRISVLDTDRGVVAVDGRISAVIYYDSAPAVKRNLFGKSTKKSQ
jgi:sporulation protein YabP